MQDVDFLVVLTEYRRWSFDTLATSILGAFDGFEPIMNTVDHCAGWQNGESVHLMHYDDEDSIRVFMSLDYGESIQQVSASDGLGTTASVFKGYAPGEIYYMEWGTHLFWATTDTGHTWTQTHWWEFPDYGDLLAWTLIYQAGWGPGQVFETYTNPLEGFPNGSIIRFSDDYGVTWHDDYLNEVFPALDLHDGLLSITEELGVIYAILPQDSSVENFNLPSLCKSYDYGATFERIDPFPYVGRHYYHQPSGDIWANVGSFWASDTLAVSHDGGLSFTQLDRQNQGRWSIIQDVDSLVILQDFHQWSYDTLQTSDSGLVNGVMGSS